jgi:hypothetical protein
VAGPGRLRATHDGSLYDLDGRAIEGPAKDSQLRHVPGAFLEWYGWYAHHPKTAVE